MKRATFTLLCILVGGCGTQDKTDDLQQQKLVMELRDAQRKELAVLAQKENELKAREQRIQEVLKEIERQRLELQNVKQELAQEATRLEGEERRLENKPRTTALKAYSAFADDVAVAIKSLEAGMWTNGEDAYRQLKEQNERLHKKLADAKSKGLSELKEFRELQMDSDNLMRLLNGPVETARYQAWERKDSPPERQVAAVRKACEMNLGPIRNILDSLKAKLKGAAGDTKKAGVETGTQLVIRSVCGVGTCCGRRPPHGATTTACRLRQSEAPGNRKGAQPQAAPDCQYVILHHTPQATWDQSAEASVQAQPLAPFVAGCTEGVAGRGMLGSHEEEAPIPAQECPYGQPLAVHRQSEHPKHHSYSIPGFPK
jgi:hypothetical protein